MFIFFKFWSIIVFGVFWLFIKRKLSLILLNIKEETVTDANFRKITGEGRSTRIFTSKVYFFFVAFCCFDISFRAEWFLIRVLFS